MKKHSVTYEQYCCVKKKNIVLEETLFHNGKKQIRCTSLSDCENCGGCTHPYLCLLWQEHSEDKKRNN